MRLVRRSKQAVSAFTKWVEGMVADLPVLWVRARPESGIVATSSKTGVPDAGLGS
jgi:hypothetical protein